MSNIPLGFRFVGLVGSCGTYSMVVFSMEVAQLASSRSRTRPCALEIALEHYRRGGGD
jgi:hypothetical protein